jgi:hypothetical protein
MYLAFGGFAPPFCFLLSAFAWWWLWDGSGMALASPVSGFSFQHFSFSAFQHRPPPSDFCFLLSAFPISAFPPC